MNNEKAKKLADEHWDWFGKTIEMIYKDAMIHGYKHGVEDTVDFDLDGYIVEMPPVSTEKVKLKVIELDDGEE